MAHPVFDPIHAFRFELGRGQITAQGAGPSVMLPARALAGLLMGIDAERRRDFGAQVGSELGRRAAARLGAVETANSDLVVEHLGGEWALSGFGSLALEAWGKVLVCTVTDSPLGAEGDPLLASILGGAIQRAFGREIAVVPLERKGETVRLLLTGPKGAAHVRTLQSTGKDFAEILVVLDRGDGRAQ